MKPPVKTLTLAVFLFQCAVAPGVITSVDYASDGDGSLNCTVTDISGLGTELVEVITVGNQYFGPGHMVGTFLTDTPEDPSITFRTTVDNDTGYAWASYRVGVLLTQPFTISAATVYTPTDWTITYTPTSTWDGTWHTGLVVISGGAPISGDPENPGLLDFSYKVTFSGSASYSFVQEMIPVPEPSVGGLLLLGGLLVFGRRRRR